MSLDPDRVSQADIAAILGCTERTVRNLTANGTLATVDRGKYALAATVRAYIGYVSRGRVNEDLAVRRNAFEDERIRRLRIENDRDEGLTVPVAEAQVVFNAAMAAVAAAVNVVPHSVAAELATMNDAGRIKHRLKDALSASLENGAREIARLVDRARRRADSAAAAGPRAGRVGRSKQDSATR